MRNCDSKNDSAFSIMEVVVAVAIFGLLAYSFPALQEMRERAELDAKVATLIQAIITRREIENKPLRFITGNACTACNCWRENAYKSDTCRSQTSKAMKNLGLDGALLTPWDTIITVDENEHERWGPTEPGNLGCRIDNVQYFNPKSGRVTVIEIPTFYQKCPF